MMIAGNVNKSPIAAMIGVVTLSGFQPRLKSRRSHSTTLPRSSLLMFTGSAICLSFIVGAKLPCKCTLKRLNRQIKSLNARNVTHWKSMVTFLKNLNDDSRNLKQSLNSLIHSSSIMFRSLSNQLVGRRKYNLQFSIFLTSVRSRRLQYLAPLLLLSSFV